MSLILEALKKLEREKKTPERGFLVTTSAAWPSRGGRGALYVLGGLLLVAAGAGLAWLLMAGRPRPVAVATAPTLAAAPPPTTLAPAPVLVPTPPVPQPSLPPLPAAKPRAAVAPPRAATPEPAASPEPTPDAELRLEAVSERDGQPVAVLSGRLVREGDAFDNVRVIRIGRSEVEIEVNGERRVLGF